MERKGSSKQGLDLKAFQIPIEKYERNMNKKSSKEKKKEILDLFTNYNQLRSEEEFEDVKNNLYSACKRGDLELIKIYLSEAIKNDSKDMIFKIDRENKTASLFKVNTHKDQIIIPRTIIHESVEYLITSITGMSNNIKTLKFVDDSAVKTIYGNTFKYLSHIEEIYFPASLTELKEGWCRSAYKLTKLIISPSNGQFIYKDDKYLLGKSDPNQDEFDILLFVRRDIKNFSIPSNIKIIASHAFDDCKYLTKVETPPNSNLQIIGESSFSHTNISEIFIPSTVQKICECAFEYCENMSKVDIPPNSSLQTLEEGVFSNSLIEEIYFPASLKELEEGWCFGLDNLNKITISPSNGQFMMYEDKCLFGKSDSKKDEFDILFFANRNIKKISIPSNIKIIASCSFSYSSIEDIFIPSSVSIIGECAFASCEKLAKVEISPNSELEIIDEGAFFYTKISDFFIPPKVSKIGNYAFQDDENLQIIEISEESKLDSIPIKLFKKCSNPIIMIPTKLKKLAQINLNYID